MSVVVMGVELAKGWKVGGAKGVAVVVVVLFGGLELAWVEKNPLVVVN